MNRAKKLKINIITSLLYQIVNLLCGFILPNFFLRYYGSSVNGLVSSITQFLAIISLCECGVGAVVQSALYRPIAEEDNETISRIYKSSSKFHNAIALLLVGYMVILIFSFPSIVKNEFSNVYTAILIIAMTISLLAQHYIGMTYKLILGAAQLSYIQMIVSTICLISNTVFSIILMIKGASIQSVKLMSSVLFLLQPLIYRIAVRKRFKINTKIKLDEEPIKQKWNGFAQHLATVVLENTDVIVLTIFSSLSNVSIYSIYHLVTSGIRSVFVTVVQNIKSVLGDMYVRKEYTLLNNTFEIFEWIIHTAVTFIYTVAAVLIVPFVQLYTLGVTDADYTQPIFGVLMCIAMGIYVIRLPYSQMVLAAGHFKQTQTSAIVEMLLNLSISIAVVKKHGLIGVAVGTIIAVAYRTIYFVWYLSKDILQRKFVCFLRQLLVDFIVVFLIVVATYSIKMVEINYWSWLIMAVKVCLISLVILIIINVLFYRDNIRTLLKIRKK